MRTLAKYAFCAENLSIEEADALDREVSGLIEAWLRRKGATSPIGERGSFRSKTRANNEGNFEFQKVEIDGVRLSDLRLDEFTNSDQIFETKISTLKNANRIDVFVRLSSEPTGSAVTPLIVYPRCPQIVRDILQSSHRWTFQGQAIPSGVKRAEGDSDGLTLADRIKDVSRVHPIIAVSELDGEELLPGLCYKLAHDVHGLAYVYSIDDDASWALSSKLGKVNSCYLGAVRLYWPTTRSSEKLHTNLWTASKLLPADESQDQQALERLTNQIRHRILGAASEALTEPSTISKFRLDWDRRQERELVERSHDSSDFDHLLASKRDLETQLADARLTISRLYSQLQEIRHTELEASSAEAAERDASEKPKSGEIRFYKKIHSKSNYDVLVPIADCGHTSWQNAAKADKAKKGLVRLEGSDAWNQVQHCGSCTGGGVWRVKW